MDGRTGGQPPLWRYAAITAVVLLVIALGQLIVQVRAVLVLLFLSFLLAAGLEPAVDWFARRNMRRGLAVAIVCIGLFVVVSGMLAIGLAPAIRQFGQLVEDAPEFVANLGRRLGDREGPIGRYLTDEQVQQAWQKALSELPTMLSTSFNAVFGLLGRIAGIIFSILTIAALTVYFMLALPRIVNGAAALLGNPEWAAVMREALGKIGGYVTGQIIISASAGISAYVFFLIAGVPYAAVLAIGVAVLDLVPQIGATLGAVLGVAMALTVSIGLAVATLIFFLIYQQFENYLLAPRVFSRATSLSPLVAFAAALLGGATAGLVGAMAALPVAAATQVVLRYVLGARLDAGRAATAPAAPEPTETDA